MINLKILRAYLISVGCLFLSACVLVNDPKSATSTPPESTIEIQLNQLAHSHFKQVEARFQTNQSRALVFRVLSDIDKTSQWLTRVEDLQVLAVYNNHQYLLRTLLNSPWPFRDRELITCVETTFEDSLTIINIYSCSDRVPENEDYLRLQAVESKWQLRELSDSVLEVQYQTWIDPAGNVPAFIFNRELIKNTKSDLKKLQQIIEESHLSDFAY